MDAKELRGKSLDELKQELSALLRGHFGLRVQQATQQLNNSAELRKTRRAIARVKTIMAEKARKA
jgi:large subunit ribosomal protein L29